VKIIAKNNTAFIYALLHSFPLPPTSPPFSTSLRPPPPPLEAGRFSWRSHKAQLPASFYDFTQHSIDSFLNAQKHIKMLSNFSRGQKCWTKEKKEEKGEKLWPFWLVCFHFAFHFLCLCFVLFSFAFLQFATNCYKLILVCF